MMAAIESFTLNLEDEEKREENIQVQRMHHTGCARALSCCPRAGRRIGVFEYSQGAVWEPPPLLDIPHPSSTRFGDSPRLRFSQAFDKVLQLIWEWEIVSEEDIRAWQADERTARLLRITIEGARALRERGEVFIDWLEHGEE